MFKRYKGDIIQVIVTILLSIIIIIISKGIYKNNFINDKLSKGVEYHKATVLSVDGESLQQEQFIENMEVGTQDITIRIEDGDIKGAEYNIVNRVSRLYNMKVKKGTKVIVGVYRNNNEINDIAIYSYDRSSAIIGISILFLVIISLVGGVRGIKAIVSLIFTLTSVIFLMLPLMLKGVSPILSAILVSILTITVTIILIAGKSKKAVVAILGTISGVVIAGIVAMIFGNLAHLSGVTMEDAESIMYIAEDTGLKVSGIMFAGILIASLGAVMDVAMSISSSIFEINEVAGGGTKASLFKSGMNIGRDVIGTMANTLILAFAGGSLTTLILLFTTKMTETQLFSLDVVGTEIIQGLSGSIGIILTVPITAIIAAYICNSKKVK